MCVVCGRGWWRLWIGVGLCERMRGCGVVGLWGGLGYVWMWVIVWGVA